MEIEKEYGLPQPTGQGRDLNLAGTGSPIPAQVRDEVRALDERFGDYMDLQPRMRAGMSLLAVRERAFATITVDVLFQTLEESLRVHVAPALSAGASPEAVRAVVRFSARFGMTKAWRALHVLDGILAASTPS
ncbi:carboxymuconolactone decarboxylase family protein [Nonomuraea sp. NPDC050536]|uniref:carboxymuconolactone decarboxylase family protein n=1 Tax=Nonomuraea sp. NPDC050536 TaxID=3364366 RepID=UPI0037C5AD6A